MSWNILLTAAGAIMGLAGVALSGHEPQFDYELAAPIGSASLLTASYQASPKVSARFHQAPVSDVLHWLDRQGVSFVIADSKLKDREITLSVQNQPLDSVVDAIARALGGRWERQGAIRVFREGNAGEFSFSMPEMKGLQKGLDGLPAPNIQLWKSLPSNPELKQFEFKFDGGGHDFAKLRDDLEKAQGDQRKSIQLFQKDEGGAMHRLGGNPRGFEDFVKSLSDKQKDLMKTQGYLKVTDLTDEQKTDLGISGNPEHLEIEYTRDGQTIIVRSK
jgi:hypothetical protein